MNIDKHAVSVKPTQTPNTLRRELDGQTYVYIGKDNSLFELNATAALILELCDGCNTVEAIGSKVAAAFEMNPDQVIEDVQNTVAVLNQQGLLVVAATNDSSEHVSSMDPIDGSESKK